MRNTVLCCLLWFWFLCTASVKCVLVSLSDYCWLVTCWLPTNRSQRPPAATLQLRLLFNG